MILFALAKWYLPACAIGYSRSSQIENELMYLLVHLLLLQFIPA